MEPVLASALAHGQLPLHPRMRLVWGLNHGVVYALALTAVLVPLSVKFDWMPVIEAVLLALTAGVSIHTAGTRLESITLPGVPHAIALQLRDALLDRRIHADGA